jgi:hypothetical protein
MADKTPSEEVAEFEEKAVSIETSESDELRKTIGNVYTFVRSREINKTIASFTFDHYLEEAKRKIKEPRILRSASDPGKGVGTRPGQLESLEALEELFNKSFAKAKEMAEAADSEANP